MKYKQTALVSIVLFAGLYMAALAYSFWKWEVPHDILPTMDYRTVSQLTGHIRRSEFATRASEKLSKLACDLKSVSISGAVAIDGNLAWADAVGLSDVEQMKKADRDSIYRIGSVSKSVTALALARMVEKAVLDLDRPIHHYLPDFPQGGSEITIRQLASHMAGVRHYRWDLSRFPPSELYIDEPYDDVQDAVAYFKHDELLFTPGQEFAYSTFGYTLLSAVMQAAAGKPFMHLVREELFNPLMLKNIGAESDYTASTNLVSFYTSDNGLYGHPPKVDLSIKLAGGGMVSTPTDLVTLGSALLFGQIINTKTKNEFFEVQPLPDGSLNQQSYALGWRHHKTSKILGEGKQVQVVHHGGTSIGGAAFWLLLPEYGISVAVMSNSRGENTRKELQLFAYQLAKDAINTGSQ